MLFKDFNTVEVVGVMDVVIVINVINVIDVVIVIIVINVINDFGVIDDFDGEAAGLRARRGEAENNISAWREGGSFRSAADD